MTDRLSDEILRVMKTSLEVKEGELKQEMHTKYHFAGFNYTTFFHQRNGYRRKKWNRGPELKSSTRVFVFHFDFMPLGKALSHLFLLQLWVNK